MAGLWQGNPIVSERLENGHFDRMAGLIQQCVVPAPVSGLPAFSFIPSQLADDYCRVAQTTFGISHFGLQYVGQNLGDDTGRVCRGAVRCTPANPLVARQGTNDFVEFITADDPKRPTGAMSM